jgi:hypothetical protein
VSAPTSVRLDPLAPIRAALAAMDARPDLPPVNGIAPGLTVEYPSSWLPATALTDGAKVDALLGAASRRWDAPPHTAAALAWKAYTYWLALPVVIGFAGSRRVPMLRADQVVVRWSTRKPFLTLGLIAPEVAVLPTDPLAAGRPAVQRSTRVRVVPDEAALLAEIRTSIMDEHLEPLLQRVRERVHLGPHTLWGSLASGIAYGLSRSSDVVPGPTLATAEQILAALGLDQLVELAERPEGGLTIQRRTCCLAFTLPKPKICPGCCIR